MGSYITAKSQAMLYSLSIADQIQIVTSLLNDKMAKGSLCRALSFSGGLVCGMKNKLVTLHVKLWVIPFNA